MHNLHRFSAPNSVKFSADGRLTLVFAALFHRCILISLFCSTYKLFSFRSQNVKSTLKNTLQNSQSKRDILLHFSLAIRM
jgi:hypothetical protein